MRILIAEDDAVFRRVLHELLSSEFEMVVTEEGNAAWTFLQRDGPPMLALLDWVMPGMTGPELCREIRANPNTAGTYVILLTGRNSAADIIAGDRAGADDCVTKPFEAEELRARIRLGKRILEMQQALSAKSASLQEALKQQGLPQSRLNPYSQWNPLSHTSPSLSPPTHK